MPWHIKVAATSTSAATLSHAKHPYVLSDSSRQLPRRGCQQQHCQTLAVYPLPEVTGRGGQD
jgi:hypothetical protein